MNASSGGSIITHFRSIKGSLIKEENIIAGVRSEEQAKVLLSHGVKVLLLDLDDEDKVVELVVNNDGT